MRRGSDNRFCVPRKKRIGGSYGSTCAQVVMHMKLGGMIVWLYGRYRRPPLLKKIMSHSDISTILNRVQSWGLILGILGTHLRFARLTNSVQFPSEGRVGEFRNFGSPDRKHRAQGEKKSLGGIVTKDPVLGTA